MRKLFRAQTCAAMAPAGAANSADSGRRSFFLKLGAGVSTALASTAGMAGTGHAEDASRRLALLEDETALRELHRSFERALDEDRYENAVALFARDAEVVFNGGVFRRQREGVSRLFNERFRAGTTGRRMGPAPGFELPADRQHETMTVAIDRLSATAVFPFSIRVGQPVESETSLAGMARLQGSGVRAWWEGGVYEVAYVRYKLGAGWKIGRLEYRTLARADYRPGRTYAMPISVPRLAQRYPEDRHGPDALV